VSPPACRVCANQEGNRLHLAREMMEGRRDPFPYVECAACGCVQIVEVPPNLGDYYGEGYYSLAADLDDEFASPALREERGRSTRELLELPEPEAEGVAHADMRRPLWSLRATGAHRGSRVLDVGCGTGRLLYLLRLAGWTELLGLDPFLPGELAYADGLRVLRRELGEVDGEWDLVMFHHAFEHLPDPRRTLSEVKARLAPGGTCLLRLPLADSEAWRRYGVDWVQLDAPRHLFLHTRCSLELLAAETGLVIEAVRHDSYALQFWGSEQYRRDIPLRSEQSYNWGRNPAAFTPEQLDAWRAESAVLNREGRGDQAAFYLRHA